ncbi:MAG: glycosyltransferase family 4 protein [Arenicellales bacterium]
MRLLYLCKQKYMRKDVILDRYGRLYWLPHWLSHHHHVTAITADYHPAPSSERLRRHTENDGNLTWYSLRVHRLLIPTLLRYRALLRREFGERPPDAVIGASDSPHIILASLVGKSYGVPVVLDLYDNFEAFGLSRMPGVRQLYRRALSGADAVTCVSGRLADHIATSYRKEAAVFTIESTINETDFRPLEKAAARRRLNLDIDCSYVGTAGALYASRGIRTVYAAFLEVVKARPAVKLLLAGKIDPRAPPPDHEGVVYLGDLSHSDMNAFYNALDVAFNYMEDDEFGRYSFPQKAYEMLACKVPVLSARVGVFADLLEQDRFLYSPGDVAELATKILALLDQPDVPQPEIPSWADQADRLDEIIRTLRP